MVDCLGKWRWGSYPALAGIEVAPPFLGVAQVLSAFGTGSQELLRERFVRYTAEVQAGTASLEDRIRSGERVLGDKAFKASVRGEVAAEPPGKTVSDPCLTPRVP